MILLDHMKLAERLGRGEVTETVKFWYYFIFLIFYIPGLTKYSMHRYADIALNIYDQISDLVFVVLIFITTIVRFRINALGDNRDFIARTICLALPIIIQILLAEIIYIAIVIAVTLVLHDTAWRQAAYAELFGEPRPIDLAIAVALTLYSNGQLVRGISRAAKHTTENSSPQDADRR